MPSRKATATRILPAALALIATALALGPPGCGDRERLSDPGPTTEDWTLGEIATHSVPAVPGVRIEDPATGEVFEFPQGGGELTVAPILRGPEVDKADSSFEISYTGPGPVELVVVLAENDADIVQRRVSFDLAIQEGDLFEDAGWIPIVPTETVPRTLRFELLRADEGGPTPGGVRATRISKFRRIFVKKGDLYDVTHAAFKANVRLALDELLLAVADHRRPEVERAIAGHLKYDVGLRQRAKIAANAAPCYAPFYTEYFRLLVACALLMIDDSPESIAHETGHYFHHVLVGTDVYRTFVPRPAGHKLGMTGAKHNLIEMPAYFAEYYLKGTVGPSGGASPERGTFLSSKGIDPSTTDFTDVEGFATAILATLTRTDAEIQDFKVQRTPVPVVSGDVLARYQACFEIIAQGTNSVPALFEAVRNYLFANGGQDDKLPAMLEPIGWSRKVTCRFVDSNGDGVAGVSARPIHTVDGVTYYLPANGVTDDSGQYTLPRAFPGNGKLRFYYDNDSTDVDCGISWYEPTNQVHDRGDIVVENAIDLRLARYGNVSLKLYCQYTDNYHSPQWVTFGPWDWQRSEDGGNDFVGTLDIIQYGSHIVEEINVSVDERTGMVTEYRFTGTYSSLASEAVRTLAFHGRNVPMTSYTVGENTVFYVARAIGEAVCTDLEEFHEVSNPGDGRVIQVTDYNCVGTGGVSQAEIKITLKSSLGD